MPKKQQEKQFGIIQSMIALLIMVKNSINTFSYTYGGDGYWTMTPYHYNSSNGNSNVWNLRKSGEMYSDSVYGNMGIRPVINLKSDVKIISGVGTVNELFVIDTN